MSDIVERLRKATLYEGSGEQTNLGDEAADEIERLRTESAATYELQRSVIDRQSDEIERLRAQVASLTEALQKLEADAA